jgi:hypothetical protein
MTLVAEREGRGNDSRAVTRGLSAIQRWRALKRGFFLQMTKTLPRRRTTLQSRCRVFADLREESTFMDASGRAGVWKSAEF